LSVKKQKAEACEWQKSAPSTFAQIVVGKARV
jgi:hypothetical protein